MSKYPAQNDNDVSLLKKIAENTATIADNGGVDLDTDPTLSGNSDEVAPSQKAVKAYADNLALEAGSVSSVNGMGGAVILTTANVADSADKRYVSDSKLAVLNATQESYSTAEKTKLAGIASGATANDTDANLKNRANHTGTQSADTIVDGTTNVAFTAVERAKLAGIEEGATAGGSGSSTREQVNLDGLTELQSGKDNFDTVSGDTEYTHTTASNGVVTNLSLIVEAPVTITFPPFYRVGSTNTSRLSSLLVPAGIQEFSLKRLLGQWWMVDSCGDTTETVYVQPTVATPAFNPVSGGTYKSSQTIEITCATPGATIRYTTDGSDPQIFSPAYTSAIPVAATIKAIAVKSGYTNSAVATATYTVDSTAPSVSGAVTINSAGNEITVPISEVIAIGAGGSGGWDVDTDGDALTLAYASGAGTSNVKLTPSRTILQTETLSNFRYVQPGAGVTDVAGNELASFSGVAVTNNSTQTGGGGSVPDPDLLWWKLNDPAGTTITADVGPGATSNTGTLNGDYLSMAEANSAYQSSSSVTWGKVVTVSVWIRRPTLAGSSEPIRSSHLTVSSRWAFDMDGGWLGLKVKDDGGSTGLWQQTWEPFPAATWAHVVGVFDNRTTGSAKLYVDGVLKTLSDKDGVAPIATSGNDFVADLLSIKSIFAEGIAFDADDLRIYSTELTPEQISAIHSAGRP